MTLDGDLQNDPADIPRLLELMDERQDVDVISGWRKERQDKAVSRKIPSMIANGIISKVTGVRLHDYGCALKLYRAQVIGDIKLYGELHRFIPALAAEVGANIIEVPVNHHPRTRGISKYGIDRTFRVILDLLWIKFFMRFLHRPMQAFGGVGLGMLGIGGADPALSHFRQARSGPRHRRPSAAAAGRTARADRRAAGGDRACWASCSLASITSRRGARNTCCVRSPVRAGDPSLTRPTRLPAESDASIEPPAQPPNQRGVGRLVLRVVAGAALLALVVWYADPGALWSQAEPGRPAAGGPGGDAVDRRQHRCRRCAGRSSPVVWV